MTNIELNMYVGQWRRLHTARGDIPPLLQMAGNGGGHREYKQETDQTVLTITKSVESAHQND